MDTGDFVDFMTYLYESGVDFVKNGEKVPKEDWYNICDDYVYGCDEEDGLF